MLWQKRSFNQEQYDTLRFHGVAPVFCTLLSNRQLPWVKNKSDIGLLINSPISLLEDPTAIANMEEGSKYFLDAKDKHVAIFGDYDADGIISSYMCERLLLSLNATSVDTYLPSRVDDGYGLNPQSVENFLALCKKDYRLIIVLDCGTSSKTQIEKIKNTMPKADIVILDHHIIDQENFSSNANCVINPRINDSTPYCAGGIVYQMVRQCAKTVTTINHLKYIPYAAITTISDVCDMTGSNRIIVKNGLDVLKMCQDPGITALFKVAEIDKTKCNVENISFSIGPMINASGRMKSASKAFQLLRKRDETKAMELAQELKTLNETRKKVQKEMAEEALLQFEKNRNGKNSALLFNEKWNHGIVGIVASKIVDKYHVPTLCFGLSKGEIKGSARSVSPINIKEVMDDCKHIFTKHGGHEMAAGATLNKEWLEKAWEEFNSSLEKYKKSHNVNDPVVEYDFEVDDDLMLRLDESFCDRLAMLEPYGSGNEMPVFLAKNMYCREVKMWKSGSGGFVTIDNTSLESFSFTDDLKKYQDKKIDFLFTLVRSFMYNKKWNIKLTDIKIIK